MIYRCDLCKRPHEEATLFFTEAVSDGSIPEAVVTQLYGPVDITQVFWICTECKQQLVSSVKGQLDATEGIPSPIKAGLGWLYRPWVYGLMGCLGIPALLLWGWQAALIVVLLIKSVFDSIGLFALLLIRHEQKYGNGPNAPSP